MAIIKKNELLKKNIKELVNPDGSAIEGDEAYDTTSQINVGVDKAGSGTPELTTDKFAKTSRQGNRYYYGPQGISYPGGVSHKTVAASQMDSDIGLDLDIDESEMSLEEIAKVKMSKMVEDIITNKNIGNDMVKKINQPDVNKNQIPDINELKSVKPLTANSAIEFVNKLSNEPLKGDEKAIMLNYILSNIELSDISSNYRNILRKKI